MHVTFYGAVREVTGSMHMLTTESDRILMDCGMFQGHRKETDTKNRLLPFDPQIVTNLVLSHAHIDHSGRIPLMVREGFTGRVICTRPTTAACEYLLADSAKIQESDAAYLNYKTLRNALTQMRPSKRKAVIPADTLSDIKKILKKDRQELDQEMIATLIDRLRLEKIQPLYTVQDAETAMDFFNGYPYRCPIDIGHDITCTLYDAGHILGSAMSMIQLQENGRTINVCYTGDLGRFGKPIIRDPTVDFDPQHRQVDLMIIESTYGNRTHEPVADLKPQLKKVILDTTRRDGTVLIPAFAFGRTQELLYVLHELYAEHEVPRIPIYVDSPLATRITRVFGEHPEAYDRETHTVFLENATNPFAFDQIHFVKSVEESMALNRDPTPHIVLAASGMCEAGRILHHLRHKIHDPKNTVLIVGFMAQNTLGRKILEAGTRYEKSGRTEAAPLVKFFNKEYPLKAHVVSIGGFSAHADKAEMLRFLKMSNLEIKQIAIVHGEEDQALAFAETLRGQGYSVKVPKRGESLRI